jgi:hypothetical protein
VTIKFLEAWVGRFGSLPPYVRQSWETCKKLMINHKTKRLDQF